MHQESDIVKSHNLIFVFGLETLRHKKCSYVHLIRHTGEAQNIILVDKAFQYTLDRGDRLPLTQ